MKNKDFIAFPMFGLSNPLIVRKDSIEFITPDSQNQLKSKLTLKNFVEGEYLTIDEPTSSIEGRL